MSSELIPKGGMYDPTKRFAFTNISSEPFPVIWDGKTITTIQPGQVVSLPHYLAVKCAVELTDKIMIGEIKMEETAANKEYYRSPRGTAIGIPAQRKPYEDRILKELTVDQESPEVALQREEMRQQILADLQAEQSKPGTVQTSVNPMEFSEVQGSTMTPQDTARAGGFALDPQSPSPMGPTTVAPKVEVINTPLNTLTPPTMAAVSPEKPKATKTKTPKA